MSKLQSLEICKQCGGECCQSCGCIFHPSQFKEITEVSLLQILKTRIVSIDWWEGDPRESDPNFDGEFVKYGYFLRMRNVGKGILDGSWCGNPCIIWSPERGCQLDFKHRPLQGVHLIPGLDDCKIDDHKYTKHGLSLAWIEYNSIFESLPLNEVLEDCKTSMNIDLNMAIDELKKLMV